MASSLFLRLLFDSDILIGSNFNSWYRKLKIIPELERILYVLTDPAPEVLKPNACDAIRVAYQK